MGIVICLSKVIALLKCLVIVRSIFTEIMIFTFGGNYDVQVDGHHYDNSNVHRKITAPRIDLN